MIRRRIAAGLLVVAVAALAASCGLEEQDRAHRIPAEDVPFGLLEEERDPTPTTAPSGRQVELFYVDGGALVPVVQPLPDDAGLDDVVALLAEPPPDDTGRLTSALGDAGTVAGVEASRGVATVDLDPSFLELAPEAQALAIAQIVLTLTGRPGVGRVAFGLDGDPVEVPTGDGSLSGDTLAREDFRGLVRDGP